MERTIPSIHGKDHVPGGPDPIPPYATAIYAIEVFEADRVVIAGDNAFEWEIPEDLDGSALTKVEGYVNSTSSSGSVQVQLAKRDGTGAVVGDLLTDKVTIEAGDLNSRDATTQPAVNTGAISTMVWGDHIRVDVDAAGVDALGLGLIAYFVPLDTRTLVLEGAKGDPGGIVNPTGDWDSGTTYSANDAVSHNGSSYVALQGSTDVEPGVDAGWQDYWMVLSQAQATSSFQFNVNGNGYPVDTGRKGPLHVAFPCSIVEATLLADVTGSLVLDIWRDTFGSYPPTDADSITGSTPLTLSSAQKTTDTALTGWTTSLSAGDVLYFNVDSISLITYFTVALTVERI